MTGRQRLGGASTPSSGTRGSYAPRDSSFSPTINPGFPRGNFAQTVIDIAALIFGALVVFVTGIGIAVSIFVLFFVRV